MAGYPAELPKTLIGGQFCLLAYILIKALVVKVDIKSVSEGIVTHVKFDFRFYMVCKKRKTAFVIRVYYIYITIILCS